MSWAAGCSMFVAMEVFVHKSRFDGGPEGPHAQERDRWNLWVPIGMKSKVMERSIHERALLWTWIVGNAANVLGTL